jgi:hypothetical protein
VADASLGELAQEIVYDLFIFLVLLFVFIELVEIENTTDDSLLLHIEIILVPLERCL